MGATSTQGIAVLLFLVGFTFLGAAMFAEGSIMYIVLFLAFVGASVAMFLKAKPMENEGK